MPSQEKRPFTVAVLISGGGTTLKNILDKIDAGQLTFRVGLVISSSPTAKGIRFAEEAGIPCVVLETKNFPDRAAYSRDLFDCCRTHHVDLVVMGGFLKQIDIPDDFVLRVVNIHPGLIPSFCGKGFYGHHVHEAVLEYGAKISGCTVHFADNEYDHGPIILQRVVPVLDDDTPDSLATRVFTAECDVYPEALQFIADGRVKVEGRRVRIVSN